jgi:hypothetical protein
MVGFLLSCLGTMNPTKRLTGICSECGGPIQFPAELIGTMTTCPRCRKQTELRLESPPGEYSVPRRVVVWSVISALVLVAGLITALIILNRFEKLAARQRGRAAAAAQHAAAPPGLEVSAFSLEKGDGAQGVCVVGTVENTSNRRRSQVMVEFDLLDAGGRKIAIARDHRALLEPGARWQIKVPVAGAAQAVSVRLALIKEGP